MQIKKILGCLLILCVSFLLKTNSIMAAPDDETIVCEYSEFGLKITYSLKDEKFQYEFDKNLKTSNTRGKALLRIWNSEPGIQIKPEFSEDLYETLKEYKACPSGFHIGLLTVTESTDGLGDLIWDYVTGSTDNSGVIQQKILYFAPEAKYKKEYKPYTFGTVEDAYIATAYESGFEDCDFNKDRSSLIGKGSAVLGFGCGAINSALDIGGRFLDTAKGWASVLVYKTTGDVDDLKDIDPLYEQKFAVDLGTIRYMGKDHRSINASCFQFSTTVYDYGKLLDDLNECKSENCKKAVTDKISDKKNNIRSQCKSMLQHFDYTGGEAQCIDDCLQLSNLFNEFEKGTLLEEKIDRTCGFSNRLIAWIQNIMKWIKYIVPIVLIVLSILDFIKAMSSEKDDEMKKAQKSFVIRLIAAVLIFLLPILIDFILDKMGFSAEGCGIFDELGK